MPRSATTAQREAGRRKRLSASRRRILIMEAAARLFAERGYSGASMTDIAAAAGIAPSVIYDHFASKRDLHLELLSQHAHALIEATTLDTEGSGEALVRRSTEAFFGFVEQHPYAWRMLFRDPPADDEIAAVHARIHRHGSHRIVLARAGGADGGGARPKPMNWATSIAVDVPVGRVCRPRHSPSVNECGLVCRPKCSDDEISDQVGDDL